MAADKTVRNSVAVADPDIPANVIKPNADGSVNVVTSGGSGGASSNIVATGGVLLVADDAPAGTAFPVPVGGGYNFTLPSYTNGDRVQAQYDSRGGQIVVIKGAGGTGAASASIPVDGLAAATALQVVGWAMVWDGTNTFRQRGNAAGTVVIPPLGWQYAAAAGGITNSTTAVPIKASAGAGLRNYISSVQVGTDVLGTATEIAIRDGAAGTVLWRMKLQATTALPVTTVVFANPIAGTAATLLEVVTLTATVTGGVYFNAQGYAAA